MCLSDNVDGQWTSCPSAVVGPLRVDAEEHRRWRPTLLELPLATDWRCRQDSSHDRAKVGGHGQEEPGRLATLTADYVTPSRTTRTPGPTRRTRAFSPNSARGVKTPRQTTGRRHANRGPRITDGTTRAADVSAERADTGGRS